MARPIHIINILSSVIIEVSVARAARSTGWGLIGPVLEILGRQTRYTHGQDPFRVVACEPHAAALNSLECVLQQGRIR
jgi:hypothetical protein